MFGKRILIAVPHPDDEVVACCATLGKAQAEGAQIFALYLSHGCLARTTMWSWDRKNYDNIVARRRAEAEDVAKFLNITPLGWSPRAAREIWLNLDDAHREIDAAIQNHAIDQLWLPAYEGGNPDHDGLNAVGQNFRQHISVVEFAEYNFSGGKAHSNQFVTVNGSETIMALTAAEQARKQKALGLYKSEKSNLDYIQTSREAYRPLGDYAYAQPPHTGTLWYARFQWVPFRHPRVDFTHPQDVSTAIERYITST